MLAGSIELICGCMFSGKTTELVRRVNRADIGGQKIQIFQSHLNIGNVEGSKYRHSYMRDDVRIVPESSSEALAGMIYPETNVVAIDDIQFFDFGIVNLCSNLADNGRRVILAGLDLDFRGEPAGDQVLELLAKADRLDKLTAICVVCGRTATMTQRIVNGMPAQWNDPIYLPGSVDLYQAVCREHHRIRRPSP